MTTITMSDFGSLMPRDQARLLLQFAFQLTISARGLIHANKPNLLEQLRAINEINHRILSFVNAVTSGDGQSYPPNVLIEIIRARAETYDLKEAIALAWDGARASFDKP